jgi:hypothetical protein
MKKIIFLLSTFCFLISSSVNAVELYLESSQSEYAPNETFSVDIRLNVTPPENVTAIEGYLKFDDQSLKAIDFLTGNSILMFIEAPKINQEKGIVSFSGIIPGGYTGRLPGDPGQSNLLGKIIFQTQKTINPENSIYFSDNSRVLLDEGKEAKTNLVFKPLDIQISSQEVVFNPLNDWEKIKEEDKTAPEEFKPEIVKINNQYFLVFNTQDKQSGIDHYEVATLKENLFGQLTLISNFLKGTSPYAINEANLSQIIKIKAIDKAGNEKIATLYPQTKIKWYKNYWLWGIIIVGIILGIFWKHFSRKLKLK